MAQMARIDFPGSSFYHNLFNLWGISPKEEVDLDE